MIEPRVSIIIPAFNAEEFIERSISSVVSQTVTDWELIIVNDGSTDTTAKLIENAASHEPRIHCIHQENQGLSAARNAGLGATRGRFVQFLDADDTLLPMKLEVSLNRFETDPELDIVACNAILIDSAGRKSHPIRCPVSNFSEELWIRNIFVVNAPLVRASLIQKVGLFATEATSLYPLYGCEDWHFWLRCSLLNAKIDCLSDVLVQNFKHDENMSRKELQMHLSELWCLDSVQNWCREAQPNHELLRRTSYLYRVTRGLAKLNGRGYGEWLASVSKDELISNHSVVGALLRRRREIPHWLLTKLFHGFSKILFLKLRRLVKQSAMARVAQR